ncbi:MAG TPA: hypothetical protein VJ934_05045, partial [Desulfomicrobiaceae bacterium]|nr:hypothetical protein [Desulfomicrobiaceae bacterium]
SLRGVDLVFRTARPEGVLILLPSTDSAGADHTAAKLSVQLNNLAGMDLSTAQDSTEARIGTATFSEQLDSPRALLETAVSNLQVVRSHSKAEKTRSVPFTTSPNPETN